MPLTLDDDSDTLSDLSCNIDDLLDDKGDDAPPLIPRKSIYRQFRDSRAASGQWDSIRRRTSFSQRRNAGLFIDTGRREPEITTRQYGGGGGGERQRAFVLTPEPLRWRKHGPSESTATTALTNSTKSGTGELHTVVLWQSNPVSPLTETPVLRCSPVSAVSTTESPDTEYDQARANSGYDTGADTLRSPASARQEWSSPLTSPSQSPFGKEPRRAYQEVTRHGRDCVMSSPLSSPPHRQYLTLEHDDPFVRPKPSLSDDRSLGSFFEKEGKFTPFISQGASYTVEPEELVSSRFAHFLEAPVLSTTVRSSSALIEDQAVESSYTSNHYGYEESDYEGHARPQEDSPGTTSPTTQARVYLTDHYAEKSRAHARHGEIIIVSRSVSPPRVGQQPRLQSDFFFLKNTTPARQIHFEAAYRRLTSKIPDAPSSDAMLGDLAPREEAKRGKENGDAEIEEERKKRCRASIRANTPFGGQFVKQIDTESTGLTARARRRSGGQSKVGETFF